MKADVQRYVGVDPLAFSMALKLKSKQLRQVLEVASVYAIAVANGESVPEIPWFEDAYMRTVLFAFVQEMTRTGKNFRKSASAPPAAQGKSSDTHSFTVSSVSTDSSIQSHTESAAGTLDGFEEVWALYPKKLYRAEAEEVWRALAPDPVTVEEIKNGISRWIVSDKWQEQGGRYIKGLDVFIKGRHWLEYPKPAAGYTQRVGAYSTGPVYSEGVLPASEEAVS